ncbi:TPA: glycosyltransferase family 4 protein [Escherichia coli]|nr:glycosyltransferase family 4 protein [Escherichia coli]
MNENDEKIARKYFSSAPWTKVTLLNNAVDIKKFQKRYIGIESKSEINEQKKFKMVMIGRLCEQKNPLLIINALKILGDHYYVDFVGDGPLRSDLESQIAKRGLEKRVRLLGWCSSVEEIIFKYDLFLLPSKWEGMPLAILEAMASKVPVLCSNIDANAYLINKTSGFLFNNDDAKDLAENIKYIFDNVDVRRKVAEDAYLAVVKDFELSERTRILESIYTNNYFL